VFCDEKDKFLKHQGHIDMLDNMEKELKTLFNLVDMYYVEYEDKVSINAEQLSDYFEMKFPKDKRKEDIDIIVETAFELEINNDMVATFLDQLHEKHAAAQLVKELMPVVEGEEYGVLGVLGPKIDAFVDQMHNPPTELIVPVPCAMDFDELLDDEVLKPGLNWRVNGVTDAISGVKPCTLGLVYAYVDSGKTSFMLDNVAYWSEQIEPDECICYCGNEELHKRLAVRSMHAHLKQSMDWILRNRNEARTMLKPTGWSKVHYFKDITEAHHINYVIKTYKPRILIIDQATYVNIKAKRRAEGVNYLEQLFQWYRRLANRYEIAIIGVSQGTATAENTKWLKLSDIYGSKVAIQGALDYAIGIGRDLDDAAAENLRYLHFPKSKFVPGGQKKLTTHFTKENCVWRPA